MEIEKPVGLQKSEPPPIVSETPEAKPPELASPPKQPVAEPTPDEERDFPL